MELFREKKWLLFFVLAFLALSVVLILLAAPEEEKNFSDSHPSQDYDDELWGAVPEEPSVVEVETSYMSFSYPEAWQGVVEMQLQEAENSSTCSFYTEMFGEKTELFVYKRKKFRKIC